MADSFERGVLRYSRRVKLLKLGERMGLDRFEAHLVIAAVQYRAQREEHVHASMGMAPVMSTRRVGYISSILLFVLFQSVILWVGWSLLRS